MTDDHTPTSEATGLRLDRRRFLHLMAGTGGAVLLGACDGLGIGQAEPAAGPTTATPVPPADLTVPAPRPSLRLASPEIGFPSPYAYGPGTSSLLALIYDTLLIRDGQGGLDPWLATSFERTGDGTTFVFELAEATWHDGRPVTADDVAFSFSYFDTHRATLPPTVLFRPEGVAEVVATGPRTGEIRLTERLVAFPEQVGARFPIVPAHVWSQVDDPVGVTDPELLVGSGPYRLEMFEPVEGNYLFTAHDDFFLGTPFVERLEMTQVANALIALRAGDLDAGSPGTGTPTREVVDIFRDDPRFGVEAGDPDFFAALSFNVGSDGPPGDRSFRAACAHAIDRQALAARLFGEDGGEPGNPGFLPRHHPAHHEVEQYPYDPDKAAELLDEAGYERDGDGRVTLDGEPLVLKMLTFPELATTAELVRDALGQIGIRIEFDPTDFFTAVTSGQLNDYEMALLFFGGLEQDPDFLRTILASQTSGTALFHTLNWRNAEFDRIAEQQRTTLDESERTRLIDRMQELVAADLPSLPLYYATPFLMYRRETFDQWSLQVEDKRVYVTGKATGELPIRPIAESEA